MVRLEKLDKDVCPEERPDKLNYKIVIILNFAWIPLSSSGFSYLCLSKNLFCFKDLKTVHWKHSNILYKTFMGFSNTFRNIWMKRCYTNPFFTRILNWENKGARILMNILVLQIEFLSQVSLLVFKCYENGGKYSITYQWFGITCFPLS